MFELKKDDTLIIGKGRHRTYYRHPEDDAKCIKVVHYAGHGGDKELERELAYYKVLDSYLRDWRGIPRFHGSVETDLGTGYVYDRIVDFDGRPSQTIIERYQGRLTSAQKEELRTLVEKLFKYLYVNRIVTMTLKPYNVLCHRLSETEIFPVVCDNLGEASLIPIASRMRWFCRLKQKRLFARFYNQPVVCQLKE